jgi:hypothetical protein
MNEIMEMSMDLKPNEAILYVDDVQPDDSSVIEQLEELGYEPQLQRYTWYHDGNPNHPVESTCALLHRSVSDDPESLLSNLQSQWEKLIGVFGDRVMLVMGE